MYCPEFNGRRGAADQHLGQLGEPQDHRNHLTYSTETRSAFQLTATLPKTFSSFSSSCKAFSSCFAEHTPYSHRKERCCNHYVVHTALKPSLLCSAMPSSSSEYQGVAREFGSFPQAKLRAPRPIIHSTTSDHFTTWTSYIA